MISDFQAMIQKLQDSGERTIAVGAAEDKDVLLSVENARRLGIARAILTGDRSGIERIAAENGIDPANYQIVDIADPAQACLAAVDLVRRGEAALPMKGFVDTSVMLKAVLDREKGLRGSGLVSHVGVLKVPGFDRLFFVSDSAMTIAPDVRAKADIIRNAVRVAHAFGLEEPRVAVLCAVEKVNEKMPATADAQELTRMNERGEITGCLVKGPLQLDNAVSPEAARHKGIRHPVAGQADILIAPDIEAGNILNKSMEYFARAEKAGVIMGARRPVILTSRASSDQAKLNSIALGLLVAGEE
nr:phosphate butyryltransferase [uncultured Oscillibacter sp.]